MNNRELAEVVRRTFDGLEGAGLLSIGGITVRGYAMTGQFSLAVERASGLSPMLRGIFSKIIKRTTDLELDDVEFGPKVRCETKGCLGIARTTCDNRIYCTDCNLCIKKSHCPAVQSFVDGSKSYPDCFACGRCIEACPKNALGFVRR